MGTAPRPLAVFWRLSLTQLETARPQARHQPLVDQCHRVCRIQRQSSCCFLLRQFVWYLHRSRITQSLCCHSFHPQPCRRQKPHSQSQVLATEGCILTQMQEGTWCSSQYSHCTQW